MFGEIWIEDVSFKTDVVWKESFGMIVHPPELVWLPHDSYCVMEIAKITRKSVAPAGSSLAWIFVNSLRFFQHAFKQLLVQQPIRRYLQCPCECHYLEVCNLPDPGLDFR